MISGILVVNKKKGSTSFQTVNKVRKALGIKKAGHTGTLDPMATGVLPVLLGSSTKLAELIVDGEKEYIATGRFGLRTDTLDITGTVTEEISEVEIQNKSIERTHFENSLQKFQGNLKQIPPMYSALKKDGKKLYELARKGIEIEREARDITIFNIELMEFSFPEYTIKVKCSKGTYIRSLIRDIGEEVGLPCVMTDLIRTLTGGFTLEDAIDESDIDMGIKRSKIIKADTVFKEYPKIIITDKYLNLLTNGVKMKDPAVTGGLKTEGLHRVYDDKNNFIGLAEYSNGELNLKYRV